MTLPVGITTATVTFGKALGIRGTAATISATVKPDRGFIWAATGDTIYDYSEPIEGDETGISFTVPHVDQSGFIDESGDEITHWAYTMSADVVFANKSYTVTKSFQVFVGQSVVDLDLLLNGTITEGVTAPSASVLSVAGETGHVNVNTLAELLAVTPEIDSILDPIRDLSDPTLATNLTASFDLKNSESLALHSPTGNGVADDTTAFAAALAAAPAGGVVVVPPAATKYLWSTMLTVNKAVTFYAPQGAVVELPNSGRLKVASDRVRFIGITFQKSAASSWINLFATHSGMALNCVDFRVDDCKFIGVAPRFTKLGRLNADGTTASGGAGSDIVTPQVLGCEFTAYAEDFTVELGGTTDALVERCWFHDYGLDSGNGDGVKIDAGSVGSRIVNNVFEDGTRDGIDCYDSSRNTITGNTFRRCAGRAIDTKWRTTDANQVRLDIITNNRAEACGGFNIDIPYGIIANNVAEGCELGFRVSQSVDSDFGGTSVATESVTVTGNLAIGCTAGDGFSFGSSRRLTVVGNISLNNSGYGFATGSASVDSSLIGNVAYGNTLGQIDAASTSWKGWFISGNQTSEASGAGTTILGNNKVLYGRLVAGTLRELLKINTSDEAVLGDANLTNFRVETKVSFQKAIIRKRATQTLATNGTVTIDVLAAQIHEITLNANATSFTVSNAATGMEFEIDLIQDSTGGRTYTFPSGFKFAGNAAPTDTTLSTRTTIRFRCGGSSTFREVGRAVAVPA